MAATDPVAALYHDLRQKADRTFADCTAVPFSGTPDPTKVFLKDGFDQNLLFLI